MDTITNMKTFVEVARCGSFVGAARQLQIAASIVTKRIDQLEWRTGSRLFERNTRRVSLTEAGQRLLPDAERLAHDVDDVIERMQVLPRQLAGRLRIKVPTNLTGAYIADMLARFQSTHPSITMEVVALDRAVDPLQEGFDVALSMFPASFAGVVEIDLCAVGRMVVGAPAYLQQHPPLTHPSQLMHHEIVNFQPLGTTWTFGGPTGPIAVTVTPRVSSNDAQVLLRSVVHGNGITLLTSYLLLPAIRQGLLAPVLADYAVSDMWVRALVPENGIATSRVQALIEFLRAEFSPVPPWHRDLEGLPRSALTPSA